MPLPTSSIELTIGRMAMGTRKHRQRQEPLWYRAELAEAPGHPFYQRLNRVLEEADFDRFLDLADKEDTSCRYVLDPQVRQVD